MSDWIERHSVNCYKCGVLFDEREGYPGDEFNGNDGGTYCPSCVPCPDGRCAQPSSLHNNGECPPDPGMEDLREDR